MTSKDPKRKSVRFPASDSTLAQIDLHSEGNKFSPSLVGLVIDEAHKGCSFVAVKQGDFRERQEIRIQIGALPALRAEVRWIKHIAPRVSIVGVFYLE